jgi:hypothetical protein
MKLVICINREDSDFVSLLACEMMFAVGLEFLL